MPKTDLLKITQAQAMRKRGLTLAEIGVELGVNNAGTIHKWVGKASAAQLKKSKSNGNIKRSEAAIALWLPEAKNLLAGGINRSEIAAKLGVSKSVVYRVLLLVPT